MLNAIVKGRGACTINKAPTESYLSSTCLHQLAKPVYHSEEHTDRVLPLSQMTSVTPPVKVLFLFSFDHTIDRVVWSQLLSGDATFCDDICFINQYTAIQLYNSEQK